MIESLVGAVVTAAVSTLGDYLWANVLPHRTADLLVRARDRLVRDRRRCLGLPSRKPIAGAVGRGRDRVRRHGRLTTSFSR